MSNSVAKPIIKQIKDSRDALDFFETVLMTRGVNGMYIYACDTDLQKALLEAAK